VWVRVFVQKQNSLHLKRFLAGKKFDSDAELQIVDKWLKTLASDFYEQDIQNVMSRYKSLSVGGDYVKK
jgi:hypothetical protein